jgi:hypothetical protein
VNDNYEEPNSDDNLRSPGKCAAVILAGKQKEKLRIGLWR